MSLGSYSCGLEEETLMRASASHVVVNSSTFDVLPLPHDAYFQTVEHTGVVWAHRRPTVDFAAETKRRQGGKDSCLRFRSIWGGMETGVSAKSKRDVDRYRESPPQSQILRNLNRFS